MKMRITAITLTLLSVIVVITAQRLSLPRSEGKQRIGFTLDNQFRNEENDGRGGVVGEYGVRTGDGCLRVTRYRATAKGGFKILGVTKRDCDPARQISRVRPRAPRPAVSRPPRPTATRPTPARPVPQTSAPSTTQRAPVTNAPVTVTTPAVTTLRTVGRPLPNLVRPETVEEEPRKPGAKKPTGITTKKPRRRNNRPKQLKKDLDFDALNSPDNPARALDKKEDPVYSFGFTAPGHGHTQSGHDDGSKKGEYYFDSPDGWRRIVTYVANKKGFFPKMRRVRIPGWTSTTPAPRVRGGDRRRGGQDGESGAGGSGGAGGAGGAGGKEGENGSGGADDDISGKQLLDSLQNRPGAGSCPYYFYYNTKVNFHWERCMLNGTKVGQYGKLHEDGFSYRTSYYADSTGYHPTSTKIPLEPEQRAIVHDFTQGVFILPKPDEERLDSEQRILAWLDSNRELLADPLRAQ